jgi:tRNA modification GTPase
MDNQCNAYDMEEAVDTLTRRKTLEVSVKTNHNIERLLTLLQENQITSQASQGLIVSNARHLEALQEASKSLEQVKKGLESHLSGEFISIDIRTALQSLGSITGQISSEDVLSSVFGRFCIGK